MSTEVDSRVVEMRFDNKQFEKETKTTLNTLEKLDEALKFTDAGKGLEQLDKATKDIKLDGIAAGVDNLVSKFSFFGRTVMKITDDIRDALLSKVGAAVNFVTGAIYSGGLKRAMNIENAHFQLQALLGDETKVQAIMADAMESVDGTAYAYDEAARAASQFAASGLESGDQMLNALKGITGVAAMTNSSFEDVSRIFTQTAGQGRLMGDQLLQLSGRGMNAAATLAKYYQEVRGESNITEADIRDFVSKGKISFETFADAMNWAFGDSAKRANETFTGSLSNMKSALARIGAGFFQPFIEQNGPMVDLFNALRIKINDVKSALVFDKERSAISGLAESTSLSTKQITSMFDEIKEAGSVTTRQMDLLKRAGANSYTNVAKYINLVQRGVVRADYAMTQAIQNLTGGVMVSTDDIKRFTEEGKIDLNLFTAAMEEEFGNEKTLTKQFSDFFIDKIDKITRAINNADLTTPLAIFYDWVEIVKDVLKGLWSIVKPIGSAFAEVFAIDGDRILSISDAIADFTQNLRLSEEGSKNLKDAFKGIFNVGKLLVDVFIGLFKAIFPINKPIADMGGGLLGLIGSFGRFLTKATEWIRNSTAVRKAFDVVSTGIKIAIDAIGKVVTGIIDLGKHIAGLPVMKELGQSIVDAFNELDRLAGPYIDSFIAKMKEFAEWLEKAIPEGFETAIEWLGDSIADFAAKLKNLDFKSPADAIDWLKQKLQDFVDFIRSNQGIDSFITNISEFFSRLREAFTIDNLVDRVETFMEIFGKFFRWIKDTLQPAFENFSVGGAVGTAGGLGLVYALLDIAKGFKQLSGTVSGIGSSFKGVLDGIKGTLVAYQNDLKADTILKIAKAIGILAISLTLLSFADMEGLQNAAMVLSLVGGVLLFGISKLIEALNKGPTLDKALSTFTKQIGKSLKNFSKAMKWRAIGKAIKDFAESIAIVAGSIIALGIMYRKDPQAFDAAVQMVSSIGIVMVAIMALMALMANSMKNVEKMKSIGNAVLKMTLALGVVVFSLKSLMKMDLPPDYAEKFFMLEMIFVSLAGIAVALGLAARIAGNNQLPQMAKTIKALAIMLLATVVSLKMLFNIDLPSDWKTKMAIMAGIFGALAAVVLVMALAARLAKGQGFKAAATILALSVMLVVVVGALMILSIMPKEKLLDGAKALGAILVAVGVALYGAGKVTDKNAYKAVLAMALLVGVIVAALGILTLFDGKALLKGVVALDAVLLAIAYTFKNLGNVDGKKALVPMIAMIMVVAEIAGALYILSGQPWDSLLAAGVAMAAVLWSYGTTLKKISGMTGLKPEKIKLFLVSTLALLPIGAALFLLAYQPWDGLLAAGVAISAVVLSFAKTLKTISGLRGIKDEKIKAFIKSTASLVLITGALYVLAGQPWDGLLAAGVALGVVCMSLAESLKMISNAKDISKEQVTLFIASALALFLITPNLQELAMYPWDGLLGAAVALGAVMIEMAAALWIASKGDYDVETIAAFVLASVTLFPIADALAELSVYDFEALLGAAVSLGLVLTEVAALMFVCSKFQGQGGAALSGLVAFDEFVGALGLSLAALGALRQIPGLEWLVEEGGQFLKTIGVAIGEFIGGIVGGLIEGITSQLPQVGLDLSAFMVNATPFIMGCKLIDDSVLAGVGILSAAIIALVVAELLDAIANLLHLNFVGLADQLSQFMIHLSPFLVMTRGIDPESIEACKKIADMIMTLTAADLVQGIGRLLRISGSFADFGKELVSFGPSIVQFAKIVKDVKPEMVEGAANAAKILAETEKNLPGHDGLVQKIFGEKSLADFGKELVLFGPAIKTFALIVKDVTPEMVEGAAAAGSIMAELANKLPAADGFAQKLFGEKSLADFGVELISFGPNLAKFATDVAGITGDSVQGAANAGEIMAELAEKLPNSDSLWESIFGGGNVTLSEFGEEVYKFGQSMMKFATSVSDMDVGSISSAVSGFRELVDLAIDIRNNEITGKNMANFAKDLENISTEGVQKFIDAFQNGGGEASKAISAFMSAIASALDAGGDAVSKTATDVGKSICDGVVSGIESQQTFSTITVSTFGQSLIDTFKKVVTAKAFTDIAKTALQGIVTGITQKKSTILNSVTSLGTSIVNQLRNSLNAKAMEPAGQNVVAGIISGISSRVPFLNQKVQEMASGVVTRLRDGLQKNEINQIGVNVGNRLANGLKNTRAVEFAAANLGWMALQAVKIQMPYNEFLNVGKDALQGLIDGLNDRRRRQIIDQTSKEIGKSVARNTRKGLDSHSPSKEMMRAGEDADRGLIIGLLNLMGQISRVATSAADEVIEPVKDAVSQVDALFDTSMLTEPVIRPTMDLTDVQNGVNSISDMFGRRYNLSSLYNNVQAASSSFVRPSTNVTNTNEKKDDQTSGSPTYEFVQNNYSPKSLSRTEIYRQTRNQFAAFRKAVNPS